MVLDRSKQQELMACTPIPINMSYFNPNTTIPYGCTIKHISRAMQSFQDFLEFINKQLNTKEIQRLESLMMPANFSSLVGEFCISMIPKFCTTIAKNMHHNGHPDLVPIGLYPNNAVQHAHEGIEIKSSRYSKGWQGHNAEESWLMVFVFDSNRPIDETNGVLPKPFKFVKVVGALLTQEDWQFSGRSETSRRTITASVKPSGYTKMEENWIYRVPNASTIENDELDNSD